MNAWPVLCISRSSCLCSNLQPQNRGASRWNADGVAASAALQRFLRTGLPFSAGCDTRTRKSDALFALERWRAETKHLPAMEIFCDREIHVGVCRHLFINDRDGQACLAFQHRVRRNLCTGRIAINRYTLALTRVRER